MKMKVEERIEEYLCGNSSYQSISDFYCRNGNAPRSRRWGTLVCDAVGEVAVTKQAEHSGHATVTAHVVCVSPSEMARWPWRA